LSSAEDACHPAGLLQAPDVLTLVEGIIVATEVLSGIGLGLVRVIVAAMTAVAAAARKALAT
jgi:hypothetical protein